MYKIEFKQKAKKQFFKLSHDIQERLTKAINEKLAIDPKKHLIPLINHKEGLYKFRMGDYRLLCSRDDERLHVLVVKVRHRKDVYRD